MALDDDELEPVREREVVHLALEVLEPGLHARGGRGLLRLRGGGDGQGEQRQRAERERAGRERSNGMTGRRAHAFLRDTMGG